MFELLRYACPIIFSRLIFVLLEVVSVVIVGHVGLIELAAYGLVSPIYLTFYLVAISYLLVFSVRAAKLVEDKKRVADYLSASLIFAVLLSSVLSFLFIIIPWLLPFLGQKQAISHLAGQFFYWICLGLPALFCSVVLSQFLVVRKHSKFILLLSSVQLVVGVLLVYYFTIIQSMGMRGLALGFAGSFWLKTIMSVLYLKYFCDNPVCFVWPNFTTLKADLLFLLRLGWPVSLQYGGELLVGIVATIMIGHLAPFALAAQQSATQYRLVFIMIPFGLSQAMSIYVAKIAHKNNAREMIFKICRVALLWVLLIVVILSLLVNWFAPAYLLLFMPHAHRQLLHTAAIFILIVSLAVIFDTIKYLLMGALRGLENTKKPMQISLLISWLVGLPTAFLLGYFTSLSAIGIRLGLLLAVFLNAVILSVYFIWHVKQK